MASKTGVRFHSGTGVLLAILFFSLSGLPGAGAQEGKTISEDPLIIQVFYPEKNETEVKVFLSMDSVISGKIDIPIGKNKTTTGTMYKTRPGTYPPIQSGLLLGSASYIYEGQTPAGKRGVKLTFYSKKKDAFKDELPFSIIVDEQTVLDGVAESPSKLTTDDDFKQKVTLTLPTDVFLRAARGKEVQIQLGPKTYKTETFQQKYMRALAGIIDAQSK